MYHSDEAVTETSLRHVTHHYPRDSQGYRDLSQDSRLTWTDLVSSTAVASPSSAHRLHPLVAHALSCVSSMDEVAKAYPAPPAELLHRVAQSHKRSRREVAREAVRAATGAAADADSGRAQEPEGAVQPSMYFTDGFQPVDYLGRSFVQVPTALSHQADAMRARGCQPPRTLRGVFRDLGSHGNRDATVGGAASEKDTHAAGVQQLRWAPHQFGHLLFSADLLGHVRLWDAQGSGSSSSDSSSRAHGNRPGSGMGSLSTAHSARSLLAVYTAHNRPIKSLRVTSDAAIMSSGSGDGTVALWDVESGALRDVLTNPEQLPVVQHLHHPTQETALLLAAVDRKVMLYDTRVSTSRCQREYTGHMGTIFNLSLLSNGMKMLTTSEDRTLRTWDYRVPVQIKQFASAGMHAIVHVEPHPQEPYLAAQSLNNKILVFQDDGGGKLRLLRHREFAGHTISGTRCQLAFSHDGKYVSSGDGEGKLFIWLWSTGELVRSFRAHAQMLVSHLWHPLEVSRVVTSAWDGRIKIWA